MPVNPNKYSGQPTYSRDVCDLMRRINALQARCNFVPQTPFGAWDFDIYEGRIYVLVTSPGGVVEDPAGRGVARMYVYDMAGVEVDDWALPVNFMRAASGVAGVVAPAPAANILDLASKNTNSVWPRFCMGDNKIFMPLTASRRTGTASFIDKPGICSFDLNGSGFQVSEAWPAIDIGAEAYRRTKAPVFGARGYALYIVAGSPNQVAHYQGPKPIQLQFAEGKVWGVCAGIGSTFGETGSTVGYMALNYSTTSLCYASSDFSDLGWVPFGEYEPTGNAFRDTNLDGALVGLCANTPIAVHEDRLYFDAANGTPPTIDDVNTHHYFGSIDITEHVSGEADLVHAGFDRVLTGTSIQTGHPHQLYATDGTYLFAWHAPVGQPPERLKRFDLASGSYIDTWDAADGIGEVIQMRVKDGVLWLLMITGADDNFQPRIESRDPDTMAVLSFFFVGTGIGQTRWSAYTATDPVDLGEPDNGVAIPDLEALRTNEAIKSAQHLVDMRNALRSVCDFFLAPTGERLHLDGIDDDENLYLIAMGDRTKYGATGGPRLTWTRPTIDDLSVTSVVNILDFAGRVEDDASYLCIRDHLAAGINKPGEGDEWTACWKAIPYEESAEAWVLGREYHVHKTYDIDIGEIDECLTILEGSPLASAPTGGT